MTTIQAWKVETAALLKEAGLASTADLDARLLLQMATGYDQAKQILLYDRVLTDAQLHKLSSIREDRLRHKPMAYILGCKEFYGRNFLVDERTLIPRPDTETLIESVIAFSKGKQHSPSIIDLCCGSGCIGVTLALELDANVTLSDISEDALSVARENAKRLLSKPVTFLQGDLLSPTDKIYDIIVSNPPYLTAAWCDEVSNEVRWEPRLALEGFSEDGLGLIRKLVKESGNHLCCGGALFLECDYRQAKDVAELLSSHRFTDVCIERDLSGRDRVVWGVLACTNS